jgi:hypothetical protein
LRDQAQPRAGPIGRRRLRCLVIIDLKIGDFTHADAGQMNLYLTTRVSTGLCPTKIPRLVLVLCSQKNEAIAHYPLANLHSKVLSSEYKLVVPDKKELAEEIARTRKALFQESQRTE